MSLLCALPDDILSQVVGYLPASRGLSIKLCARSSSSSHRFASFVVRASELPSAEDVKFFVERDVVEIHLCLNPPVKDVPLCLDALSSLGGSASLHTISLGLSKHILTSDHMELLTQMFTEVTALQSIALDLTESHWAGPSRARFRQLLGSLTSKADLHTLMLFLTCQTCYFVNELVSLDQLTTLHLHLTELARNSTIPLAMINQLPLLRHLTLHVKGAVDTFLGPSDAQALSELRASTSLRTLVLFVGNLDCERPGVQSLVCLGKTKGLRELQISFCNARFGRDDAACEFDYFGKCTGLEGLQLSFYACTLSSEEKVALEALKLYPHIRRVFIST
eukprot:NODE_3943_length_1138_cov_191.435468_g3752_i0.p1 GENE.NODE_3943_length_1138_cov_191.435468_g3752_i0~~NODE_3943_length_1138_cov_191.435468_g3752_i0.p1  ORF type:complete len:336 (+),score=34.46 NODE_3943_length_1138_cov_191.435468_g3752_i0:65-1072(+)